MEQQHQHYQQQQLKYQQQQFGANKYGAADGSASGGVGAGASWRKRQYQRDTDSDPINPNPSIVVHVRNISPRTTEADLIEGFSNFGPIAYAVMCMPGRRFGLVEFEDIEAAKKCVASSLKSGSISIAGQAALVNFSTSVAIERVGLEGRDPNKVLVMQIQNAMYPINVEVIYKICSTHGKVLRIAIIRKTLLLALVEFESDEVARKVKHAINGADIYSGCCTLKVEFAKTDRVKVNRNDDNQWDFENESGFGSGSRRVLLSDNEQQPPSTFHAHQTEGRINSSSGSIHQPNMAPHVQPKFECSEANVSVNYAYDVQNRSVGPIGEDYYSQQQQQLESIPPSKYVRYDEYIGGSQQPHQSHQARGMGAVGAYAEQYAPTSMMTAEPSLDYQQQPHQANAAEPYYTRNPLPQLAGTTRQPLQQSPTAGMYGGNGGSFRGSNYGGGRSSSNPFGYMGAGNSFNQFGSPNPMIGAGQNQHYSQANLQQFQQDDRWSNVVMIFGINHENFSCDRIFNLLCCYGNCLKVKFFQNKRDLCLAEMSSPREVTNVLKFLNRAKAFDCELSVRPSKEKFLRTTDDPFDLSNGQASFKDYSSSRNHRFIGDYALKNRLVNPSAALNWFNAPQGMTKERVQQLFEDARERGAKLPSKVTVFQTHSARSAAGIVEFSSIEEATESLMVVNHAQIHENPGRPPYIFKLAFCGST